MTFWAPFLPAKSFRCIFMSAVNQFDWQQAFNIYFTSESTPLCSSCGNLHCHHPEKAPTLSQCLRLARLVNRRRPLCWNQVIVIYYATRLSFARVTVIFWLIWCENNVSYKPRSGHNSHNKKKHLFGGPWSSDASSSNVAIWSLYWFLDTINIV